MMVNITLVPKKFVDRLWPSVALLLLKGREHWEQFYELEDIKDAIKRNDIQLWVYIEDKKLKCICLTSIVEYPKCRVLRYHYLGGSGLRVVKNYVYLIENWAKQNGATGYELLGRPGWKALFHGKSSLWMTGKF